MLAQQIVAEASNQPWHEQALFDCLRQATPYAELDQQHYQALLRILPRATTAARACAVPICTAMR